MMYNCFPTIFSSTSSKKSHSDGGGENYADLISGNNALTYLNMGSGIFILASLLCPPETGTDPRG